MNNKTDEPIYEFRKEFEVHSYNTDTHGLLSLPMVFNYLQDIASEHADRLQLGFDDLNHKDQFWVLSRMYVQVDRYLPWHCRMRIVTWPRGVRGLFALRDFLLEDASTGECLGYATSYWLVVDRRSRRPKRLDSLLEGLSLPERKAVYEPPLEKLPGVEPTHEGPHFQVKYSDLDLNIHVNNVRFVQWALDTYPLEFHQTHRPVNAEINYLHESLPGDEIRVLSRALDEQDSTWLHSIMRVNDRTELARLRISWNDCCYGKK